MAGDKYIVIVGCGRLGAYLANSLGESKQNSIVVIDTNENAFERLEATFSGFTMLADALELETLEKAKVDKADIVVVATNNDNKNIMIGQIVKEIFHAPRVIARLIDPSNEKIYSEVNLEAISPIVLSAMKFKQIIEGES